MGKSSPHIAALHAAVFQEALDGHNRALGLMEGAGDEVDLFHMLASAIEWCDRQGVDFDLALEEVREHFKSEG